MIHRTVRLLLALWLVAGLGGCALTGDRTQQLQQDGVFVYPAAAKAARTTGEVKVRFDITADGRVENARVVSAAPAGIFEAAALAYVQGRRYLPARKDGAAVAVRDVIARIRFDLGDVADYPAGPAP
jgi:TonB family protein